MKIATRTYTGKIHEDPIVIHIHSQMSRLKARELSCKDPDFKDVLMAKSEILKEFLGAGVPLGDASTLLDQLADAIDEARILGKVCTNPYLKPVYRIKARTLEELRESTLREFGSGATSKTFVTLRSSAA